MFQVPYKASEIDLIYIISFKTIPHVRIIVMISVFEPMRLRLREVKQLALSHTAIKWDLVSASKSHVLNSLWRHKK